MQVTIEVNTTNPIEAANIKMSLEKLSKNINKSNLTFLAELSEKKGINEKIESKKTMLKTFL